MGRTLLAILVLSGATASALSAEGRGRPANATATPTAAPEQAALPAWSLLGTLVRDEIALAREHSDDPTWTHVASFYAQRGDQPAWMDDDSRAAARVLLDRLRQAEEDGLDPARYQAVLPPGPPAASDADLREAVARDVALTFAVARFATDVALGTGRVDDEDRQRAVLGTIASARDEASARRALTRLEPPHPEYHALKLALQQYRQIAARGGWEPLPEGILLRQQGSRTTGHDRGDLLTRLCLGLVTMGDLPHTADRCLRGDGRPPDDGAIPGEIADEGESVEGESAELTYDDWLEAGVRRFQSRHGLVADGIVGRRTIAAFNVTAEDRVDQIALNMNRWRALPADLGATHVRVNIPAFRLYAVDDTRRVLEMRVVVGRTRTPTPVMSDEISYLELRPYWNVPDRLMRRDLLPRILEDPGYLSRMRFDVIDGWTYPPRIVDPASIDWTEARDHFPYRLRQRPGRQNSMGLVKFMFPNEYHVYLHDTPATHLFDNQRRAYSAACVRVEDPIALADFLLRDDPEWLPDTIERAMHEGSRQVVNLREPIPVHLTYFTAFASGDRVEFRADLYGHDREDRAHAAV